MPMAEYRLTPASIEQHMIYFRITTYGVSIIRILHDRMDAPRKL